jgi:hypothetical protein
LQSYPESMLGVMFSGRFAVTKDKKGRPFIEYSLLYPSLFLLFLSLSPPLLSFSFYPSISLGFIWRLDCVLVHVFSRPGRPFAYVLNVLRGLPLDLPSVSSISLSLSLFLFVLRASILAPCTSSHARLKDSLLRREVAREFEYYGLPTPPSLLPDMVSLFLSVCMCYPLSLGGVILTMCGSSCARMWTLCAYGLSRRISAPSCASRSLTTDGWCVYYISLSTYIHGGIIRYTTYITVWFDLHSRETDIGQRGPDGASVGSADG